MANLPYDKIPLIDNHEKKEFELCVEGQIAKIEYVKTKTNKIYLTHTEVPPELEGMGEGNAIVKKVLDKIRRDKIPLVPMCPFVAAYIKRYPDYMDLLDEGINI